MPTKRAVSAGGVVFSFKDNAIHVVVCGRKDKDIWVLPKGAPATGEGIEDTASREVKEETGLDVEIVRELGAIDFWFIGKPERVRYHKTVYHYLFRAVGGDTTQHDWEFDEVKWVPIDEAYRLLTYDNEIEVLRRAEDAVRELSAAGAWSEQ